MLSNNKKTLLISTLIISAISVGGSISAGPIGINAEPTVADAEQTAINVGQTMIGTEKKAAQAYQFPSSNAVPQISSKPQKINTAQAVNSVAKPPERMAPPPYPKPRSAPYPGQNRFAPPMPTPYNSPSAANAFRPNSVPMMAPFGPGPGRPPGYGRPNGPAPYAAGPYGQRPYNPPSPHNQSPYGRPAPYGRPYNSAPFNNGGGSFGNNPMDNFGFGPFSKNSNRAPWETWPFGGPDSLWNRREIPFKEQNPTDWFQPGDPREGMAIMWDDLIAAPDELGEMPGGWYVPSIGVPNPVDLEDQLEKASKEIPDLIRVYN